MNVVGSLSSKMRTIGVCGSSASERASDVRWEEMDRGRDKDEGTDTDTDTETDTYTDTVERKI